MAGSRVYRKLEKQDKILINPEKQSKLRKIIFSLKITKEINEEINAKLQKGMARRHFLLYAYLNKTASPKQRF